MITNTIDRLPCEGRFLPFRFYPTHRANLQSLRPTAVLKKRAFGPLAFNTGGGLNEPALSEDLDPSQTEGHSRQTKSGDWVWVVLHHVCSYVLHCSGSLKQTEIGQGEMAKTTRIHTKKCPISFKG